MSELLQQLKQKNITAFTHSGKFHADDVFSSALLRYINPEITITRGNRVPEDFEGIAFDIGRGRYTDSIVALSGYQQKSIGGCIFAGKTAYTETEEYENSAASYEK